MNDDAIYKAYCDKMKMYDDYDLREYRRKEISKTLSYLQFKYGIRLYAFYLVFRMPFVVARVKIKRLFC